MGLKTNLNASPLIGVFSTCNDELLIVPRTADKQDTRRLEEALGVGALKSSIGGSSVIGCLACMNNQGSLVTRYIFDEELALIGEHIKVSLLPDTMTAVGNIVLANDTAALVHPDLSEKALRVVAETLGVDARRGTIAGLGVVGMAGVATNKGLLVHPGASEEEIGVLEDLFSLPVDVGTVNFGSPLVGSGLLANSKGYATGSETTGPEIGRIEDALGYL